MRTWAGVGRDAMEKPRRSSHWISVARGHRRAHAYWILIRTVSLGLTETP
jgi:hypothetical protein